MFPFFIPMNFGGGGGGGWRGVVAMLVAMPLYAFFIAAIIDFSGVDVDKVLFTTWYGVPSMMAVVSIYIGAVVATAMAFDR